MVRNHAEKKIGTKKAYENPKMEIVSFQAADVIVTSGFNATSDSGTTDTVKWTGYY